MMDELRAYELSRLYAAERIAEAERARLLAEIGQPRPYVASLMAWSGGLLIRVGHRIEGAGGVPRASQPVEMRRRLA